MRSLGLFISLLLSLNAYAFNWVDLWSTKNQQAQRLMKKGQYKEAEVTFQQPEWRATAAYRAGDYEQAAKQYQALQTELGFYNQGNALAQSGKYEEAIKAYDAALAINSNNQDAVFNRKLVQDLLKKKNQDQQNKDQQNKDQQDQNQQNKNQQNKDQQDQNQQSKDQQNKDKQDQNQQSKDQQNKDKQDQNQQNKDQQNKDKKDQNQQNDQQNKDKQKQQDKEPPNQAQDLQQSPEELEKQQAKEQWLRLIPDDPGGLLRQKFLRDHLRREEGWYQ